MAIQEIRVAPKTDDPHGKSVLAEAKRSLNTQNLQDVRTLRVFRVEGATEEQARILSERIFTEPITHASSINGDNESFFPDATHTTEVAYKPGVMNPEAESIVKAAADVTIPLLAADSSTVYAFYGDISEGEVSKITSRLLVNDIVQHVVTQKPETLLISSERPDTATVPIRNASDEELLTLSKDKLFLNLQEMQAISDYFRLEERDPTDCELEIIAAWWSEHCGHKTFKSELLIDGEHKKPMIQRLQEASRPYFAEQEILSAYVDNSGVKRFYEGMAMNIKWETHNSPSAIEPRGGSMTGSGGVFRDIVATGQGAHVIASQDVFCLAPPDLDPVKLPPGTLPPDYLLRNDVFGVRDYGNPMGVPTNNGSLHFHDRFMAKPTVLVGANGILPEEKAQKGEAQVHDLVVVMGGRTGRDGIHGATFSSGEMTDRTISVNSAAVQIGNPIEEKKMFDAILEARDQNLIRAITDCGAAGFSSAVGELGRDVGVMVDISKVPLKYDGLAPWEIWLSESQERMALAVALENIIAFEEICRTHNVEATVLGQFDGSKTMTVMYEDTVVADLDYDFLERGLPKQTLEAFSVPISASEDEPPSLPSDWQHTVESVLSHWDVCSKEPIVRQYDHTVQGMNALPPFAGVKDDGPTDAAVLTPILGKPHAMILSHGLNPMMTEMDPYNGAVYAFSEALANLVAVGGNPKDVAANNNYITPFPDQETLASLSHAVDGVVASIHAFGIPVISGKDSLSSTYRWPDGKVLKIPLEVCIALMGKIPDVEKTISSDIKTPGESSLYLVGAPSEHMGGTTYLATQGLTGKTIPLPDLETLPHLFQGMHDAIQTGKIRACHDVSEGGIITAAIEMAIGGDCGISLDTTTDMRPDYFLFNQGAGMFVTEVGDDNTAQEIFGNLPYVKLGETTVEKQISATVNGEELFSISTDHVRSVWQKPMKEIFQ